MTLEGLAQSNASVAEYMRNIEASPWMGHADLRKTENTHGDTRMPYSFGLDVALSRPKSDENGDGADSDRTPIMPATSPAKTPASAPAPASTAAHPTSTTPQPAKPSGAAATAMESAPASPAGNGGAKP